MRALAVLLLVPGFSLGLVAGLTNLVGAPKPVAVQATDFVWADRVFASRTDFASWLASRGSDYEVWSERHPAAARHFDDSSVRPVASHSTDRREPDGSSIMPRAGSTKALLIASSSLALLLAMLALSRVMRSARHVLEPPRMGRRVRSLGTPAAFLMAGASGQSEPAMASDNAHALEKPRPAFLRVPADLPWRGVWSQINRLRQSVARRLPAAALPRGGAANRNRQESWNKIARLGRIGAYRASAASIHNYRVVRHYLPRVTFYAVAVFLSFAIGASVAIYLK